MAQNLTFQRITVQHGYSLFVNLPAIWCKKFNVTRRDKIMIDWDLENDRLIIKKLEGSND